MKLKLPYLLAVTLFITSCSKEKLGPMGLRHGQVVTVQLSHQFGGINDHPVLIPTNEKSAYHLRGFDDREPGYNYVVKAKVHLDRNDPPIQDAAPYWLNFIEVVKQEKQEENDPFKIALIQSYIPGGPVIMLREYEGEYHFISEKITLIAADEQVAGLLDEIWKHNEPNFCYCNQPYIEPKWKSITATVTHNPENFGKSYVVTAIELMER